MKKLQTIRAVLGIVLGFVGVISANQPENTQSAAPMAVNVQPKEYKRVPFLIGVVGKEKMLFEVADGIKKDLEFLGQYDVVVERLLSVRKKSEMADWFEHGYELALFMNVNSDGAIEWRLYDTAQAAMLRGKKTHGNTYAQSGHTIADEVVDTLTGAPGFFSTKIAYCKDVKVGKKKVKHVCVADYDGGNERVLVTTPTINLAPRWNRDPFNPILFYSESTNENIRLMTVGMQGQRKIASNFDGLNMLP